VHALVLTKPAWQDLAIVRRDNRLRLDCGGEPTLDGVALERSNARDATSGMPPNWKPISLSETQEREL
jgi:hypothetical protein